MIDSFLKLVILAKIFGVAFSEVLQTWKKDVWEKDLDSRWCCDGRECTCRGDTIRDIWLKG